MSATPEVDVNVERGAVKAVLVENRSFRNLLLASATSSIGDWIGLFALIALAETLAGTSRAGALAVSFVMIARVVPTLFIAPVAGVFVDRWDRKRTMIVTDVIRGAVMLVVPFVQDAFQLVIATFVIEVAAALFIPAKDAVVPTIVNKRRLVNANQLSLLSTYSTLPLGALLCAAVIAYTESVATAGFFAERPEAVPILLNALSFFGSIVFIARMTVPDDHVQARAESDDDSSNALTELRDGLAFIAGMPLIRALVVGIMAAFLAAGVVIGVGKFFATIMNAGEAGFAMLGFIVGTGLVAGIGIAGSLARRVAKERLFAPGILAAGSMLVTAALMPTLLLAALPVFLMGFGAGISFIVGYTMLQEYSEDELRGRIFATFNTAVRMALFASLVLGPLTITVLGVERTEAQLASGVEIEVDQLEDGADGVYPYQIGGVRLTLILSGLIAVAGSVWTGAAIRRVLRGGGHGTSVSLVAGAPPDPDTDETLLGRLVVFEGGEGAGKSTQTQLLRERLEAAGRTVVVTREPGGTPLAEDVRSLLLDGGDVNPRAEALLYAAARAQHTDEVLRPALADGAVVLCDRFVDSSIVYQGVGRELGTDVIAELNRWATDDLTPDLTIVLDVDASVGLRRAGDLDAPDRLEAEPIDFHRRVNNAFRHRAAEDPSRYLVLDANRPAEELELAILARVAPLVGSLEAPEDVTRDGAELESAEPGAAEPEASDAPAAPATDATSEAPTDGADATDVPASGDASVPDVATAGEDDARSTPPPSWLDRDDTPDEPDATTAGAGPAEQEPADEPGPVAPHEDATPSVAAATPGEVDPAPADPADPATAERDDATETEPAGGPVSQPTWLTLPDDPPARAGAPAWLAGDDRDAAEERS